MGSQSLRKATKRVPHSAAVWVRDDGVCRYCGYPADLLDRIVPASAGLDNRDENLVLSCRRCSSIAKGLVFASFEDKRDAILLVRRPEMVRDAQRWANE